ncbi:MAG: hypothetical protein B7Y53_01700, partial [Halothiobacillus sp. 28-55-5]
GKRVTELMKQKQFKPLSVAEMALSLTAANDGYLDDVPVEKINDFETALHDYAAVNAKDLAEKIGNSGAYNDEIAAQIKHVIESFKSKGVY